MSVVPVVIYFCLGCLKKSGEWVLCFVGGETQDFASLLAGGGELLTGVKNWWGKGCLFN